jgi:hypothetical protein
MCSKEVSDSIEKWVYKTDTPDHINLELYDSKGDAIRNLEPTYNCGFADGATDQGTSYPRWSTQGPMINFTYFREEFLIKPSKETAEYDNMSLPRYSKDEQSKHSSAGEGSKELNSLHQKLKSQTLVREASGARL